MWIEGLFIQEASCIYIYTSLFLDTDTPGVKSFQDFQEMCPSTLLFP